MTKLRWCETIGTAPFNAFRNWKFKNYRLHNHDYAEIFWTERDQIFHHINGAVLTLKPGTAVMVRADDYHGFTTLPGKTIGLTNVSFTLDFLDGLKERYFLNSRTFFWSQDPLPWMQEMTSRRLRKINEWADELSRGPREPFYIDRFLLNILGEFSTIGPEFSAGDAPNWLLNACSKAPERLADGIEGFFRLCGKSREHVARTMRRDLKTTPTEYLNKLRMAYARHQLEMGSRPIIDIAMDCGLDDLSHFYTLFRRETGTTPRAFRLNATGGIYDQTARLKESKPKSRNLLIKNRSG